MDDLTLEFLQESYENLDRLDQDFVKLEVDPGNPELLQRIFRTIHTIKGTCGFLGFSKLEALAHAGENLLSALRDGKLSLNSEITTALLAMVDAVRQMLGSIDATGNEGERDDSQLIAKLTRLLQPASANKEALEPALTPKSQEPATPLPVSPETPKAAPPPGSIGDILIKQGTVRDADLQEAVRQQEQGDPRPVGEILMDKGVVKPKELLDALNVQQQARASASDSSIRVDVGHLDRLMDRVGELVLARNQILQYCHSTEDSALLAASQRLNLITTELQESVMKTRMQPIGNVWSKFPRTVRDVALTCGKKVRIEMHGKETDLDKTILEAIKDPLTHIVRNSVDHGIESPDRRLAAGKSAEGCLTLRAYHESGHVNIEISDDGGGLDLEKVKRKAVEKALITAEQALRMTAHDAANLIFLPGFSTAEKVTNVSGRGVGMDVVRTNIDKIGGTVDVQSQFGAGTTVRMKIPLTLAIIPVLMVKSGSERFAIPQVSLLELLCVEESGAGKGIENVQGHPVYRLRGHLLPLLDLSEALHLPRAENKTRGVNIIVLQAEGRPFGLVIDEVNDSEEIVVKPLSKELKEIGVFAGATILGDGQVALILDVRGLAQMAGLFDVAREKTESTQTNATDAGDTAAEKQSLLVFRNGKNGRMAMELSLVARLEELSGDTVERAGKQELVQYRGRILPLIRISEVLERKKKAKKKKVRAVKKVDVEVNQKKETLQVAVCTQEGRTVGLVVDQILDIVEESLVLEHPAGRPGVRGTAVLQKKVTDLLDVNELLRLADLRRLEQIPELVHLPAPGGPHE
jgi:two-component system, chemotaxis family, sensor kinase CheA